VAVSVETCPHYLFFAAEEIPDGATAFKCAPPVRARATRERLWDALASGTIDLVATDHSPAPPATKCLESGDFLRAWGGISSLQLGLAAVWTAARERGHAVTDIVAWMCRGPARLAGLVGRKGTLAVGCDADLVIWDPDATWEVDGAALYHRHPLTPYAGRRLYGVVLETWLRGARVFGRDERIIGPPQGRLLAR
jgi:allantoinase